MASSVYTINKGINKPIEFKGFKAQYIWYLGGGLLLLLILFAILYITGLSPFLCIGIVGALGVVLVNKIRRWSNDYGEHGLMKKLASKKVPAVVRVRTRLLFISPENYLPWKQH
ncbi:DUF4133 domain-containing protein [Flavihumibacter cheonanensis]|uniref:DUF4133 domain-containing protein n=1 Tax=Flavihumibacter TaxID=1004301 RepID=UPI001EF77BC3|nr:MULTISPECIES: DUF4133 domain-containing protein [Flavihumibacter]MCG7752206.1 DUF4133 domain-containing protein [Flavihumibacter cheonanensis]